MLLKPGPVVVGHDVAQELQDQFRIHQEILLRVEIEHETGSLVELGIDIEVAIDLQCHLATDRQSESVAFRQVSHLKEGLEHVFALLLRDTTASI